MRFCIVGTGRCGTTLLRNMLNENPDVFVLHETHWIPKMYEFFGTRPGSVDALIGIVQRTRHVTGQQVTAIDAPRMKRELDGTEYVTVADFCDRLGQMFASDAGKKYWADKTPDYGPYLSMLQTLWPDCRFIHLIRNGADVACSMSVHPGYRWLAGAGEVWWCPPSFNNYHRAVEIADRPISDFVTLWRRRLLRIRDELARLRPGSLMEFRFEELVSRPDELLDEIACFLDLGGPQSQKWYARAVAHVRPEKIQSHASADVLAAFGDRERRLFDDLGY